MSLKKAREHLLYALDERLITEEEFLLLYDVNRSTNLDFPHEQYPLFDLDDMQNDECLAEFRVHKHDLPILAEVLGIPDQFVLEQRSVVGGMEALCMLLKRLTYPCRYSDLLHRFGQRPVSSAQGHSVPLIEPNQLSYACNSANLSITDLCFTANFNSAELLSDLAIFDHTSPLSGLPF
ncbi:unnamed protein product [Porites lobata]|uniref:Uncharacterized protein n=2 Tax=Porites lobata TaxID=104759 RepID=A0ABN8QD85_9CNID|nr:unnamed protein product [Porites lobata]